MALQGLSPTCSPQYLALTEANTSLTQENTLLKEDLLWLQYHQRRNNLVFDAIPEEMGEKDQSLSHIRFMLIVMCNIVNLQCQIVINSITYSNLQEHLLINKNNSENKCNLFFWMLPQFMTEKYRAPSGDQT